jgi:hypothetical protein
VKEFKLDNNDEPNFDVRGTSNVTAWKLVAYDEDDKEFNVDVHSNDVAYLIEDFLSEQFGEINDERPTTTMKIFNQ